MNMVLTTEYKDHCTLPRLNRTELDRTLLIPRLFSPSMVCSNARRSYSGGGGRLRITTHGECANILMLSLEPYELSYMQINQYFSRGIAHI